MYIIRKCLYELLNQVFTDTESNGINKESKIFKQKNMR